MATPQASSRLELLQARFQQKQLQEKEQKLLQLYDQQQQRAYQVVQRGSAGSNGSNHGSSISQHSVTKTTTTSHTTSTSQGGKVRQMFDERRQTTVKGIDRSYPLEPLENKPRKQTNGNVVQKNGNLTVNRQSVTVKRVARADVNSNLNSGKPIVSYHEEITRESYGPGGRQPSDDDEFGNENHMNQYANGNQTHIEEVLDEDTIERNRMMAKLHLMEYDETLKHRVKNDLESEEFPEDYMVDVPDKLPKQSVTKKLSQAEARLERFKNANAKRSNSVTKNPSTVLKKRSDPIFPAKSTSSEDESRARIHRGSSSKGLRNVQESVKNMSLGNMEDMAFSLNSEKNLRRRNENPRFFYEYSGKLRDLKDEELIGRTRRSGSPQFFCKESEKSATTYAIDSKSREKLSPEFIKNTQRSESPNTTRNLTPQFSKNIKKRSESPKFFCKESERSATTYAIDSKTREKLSPEFTRDMRKRSESPKFFDLNNKRKSTDQLLSKDRLKRSESPKFFCKESEKSATTYAIDSKTREKLSLELTKNIKRRSESPNITEELSPHFSKNIKKRSDSPTFFCKESEKSATTYAIDSKTKEKLYPKFTVNIRQRTESPKLHDSKIVRKSVDQLMSRSESPKFFCKESEKSATTYAIDSKTRERLSPEFTKKIEQRSDSPKSTKRSSNPFLRDRVRRSESPKFFCKETEKSATTYAIDSKTREKLSPEFIKNTQRSESPNTTRNLSPQFSKNIHKRSESPKFFCKESEKSATTYAIDSRSRSTSPDSVTIKLRSEENIPIKSSFNIDTVDRKIKRDKSENIDEVFSPKTYQKIKPEMDAKSTTKRMPNVFERLTRRSSSSKCLQTKPRNTKFSKSPDFSANISQKRTGSPESKSPNSTKKLTGRCSTSPQFFTSDSERSASIMVVIPETIVKRKPHSSKSDKNKQNSIIHKPDTFTIEPRRKMSEEIIDESFKNNIRSSVSQFFSEQCEKVSRNSADGTKDTVQSAKGGWSRDSSPLSLKDMGTSLKGAEFSGKALSATSIDSIRDWSPKSMRNSRSLTPESPKNKNDEKSIENTSIKHSKSISQKNIKKSKSKSPEIDRGTVNVLRSTRLIRDVIKRQNDKKDQGSRRNSRNVEGISLAANLEKKVEPCGKVKRAPLAAAESSPKSSTSVEVDAEMQEITMPDQYIEHRSGEVNSKSRDKTRRSSTEELFTYSVRKPGRKRASLFESSVFELSKRDQEKTFGKYAGRNEKDNHSPTNDLIFRSSKCQIKGDGKVNRESESQKGQVFGGCNEKDKDDFRYLEGNWSSSPSPMNSLTFRRSKYQMENGKIKRKMDIKASQSQEKIIPGNCSKEKDDKFKYSERNWSSSPSPTNTLTFRGSKRGIEENGKINRKIETKTLRLQKGKGDNWSSSPSPTNTFTFRGSKRETKENGKMSRKNETKALQSQKGRILDEYNKETNDNCKYSDRNWSRSSSPTSNLTFHDSKSQMEENEKVSREIEAEIFRLGEEKILDKYSRRKHDNFEYRKKALSSSPSPTSSLTFRGSKRQTEENGKLNRKTSRKEKVLNEYNKEKHGNLKYIQRNTSNSPSSTDKLIVYDENGKLNQKIEIKGSRSREGTQHSISLIAKRRLLDDHNKEKNYFKSSSPSPTSNSTICSSKNVTSKIITKETNRVKNLNSGERKKILNESKIRNKSNDLITPASKRKTTVNRTNERVLHRKTPSPIESKQKKSSSKSAQMTKESQILRSMELVRKVIKGESFDKGAMNKTIDSNEKKSDSTRKSSCTIIYINDESSRKNYERTDSVESALRRFDSIGTESVQSNPEKRQTLEEAKAISLKALDRIDANLPQSLNRKPSLREISSVSQGTERNESKTECQRKFARARDSIEIVRITVGSKTPACKRKLFQDDSGEETETGSSRSRYSSEKSDLRKEKIFAENNQSRDEEVSLSVKQLRSIEDIRKSIDSCFETKAASTKSAIANDTLKRLPRRLENFAGKRNALGDTERSSIKCAIRFSRVTKSPSPDLSKTTETSSRARRNVLSSPSKSPDTVARRPSTEMKGQEARSTKRPTLMKGAEPIGNRKTTTTITSRRKSTDVVDGAVLENGVHLRDQTAETKYDNDSAATKKSDAFVVDFDEQPPKENDAPLPRKSLLKKQSTDKQIPSTQAGRSPSAMSSTCTGNVVQGQVSGSKGKVTSKAKTPTSGATQKTSASSRGGGNGVVADSLVACKICDRRFAQDRVTLHEQICTKTAQKKRKQFDAMIYRVKGTDLEQFVRSGHCKKQPEKLKKPAPKSNWRRKHEDFINAIRSAKQVQAHLAAGGKLSDLPPPPASDTSDYVQCPHCGRKFNQSAAERHIPKCENMLHNKPIHSRAPKPKR